MTQVEIDSNMEFFGLVRWLGDSDFIPIFSYMGEPAWLYLLYWVIGYIVSIGLLLIIIKIICVKKNKLFLIPCGLIFFGLILLVSMKVWMMSCLTHTIPCIIVNNRLIPVIEMYFFPVTIFALFLGVAYSRNGAVWYDIKKGKMSNRVQAFLRENEEALKVLRSNLKK